MKSLALPVTLDDQPAEEDLLNFEPYYVALRDRLVHPNTGTPLTLGILGPWGSGKSSLMWMLRKSLQKEKRATVWFNAWRYNKEDELWAALLQSILNQVADDLSLPARLRFHIRLFFNRLDGPTIARLSLQTVVRVLAIGLPFVLGWPWVQQLWQTAQLEHAGLARGILATVLGWWGVARPMIKAIRDQVSLDFTRFRKSDDYREHISFLDRFREHFGDVIESLPLRDKVRRLVVFIDDLDRCAPDRILEVLDSTKLFLDVHGCVFVLGLDNQVVQKAVESRYKDSPAKQRQYLEKIIQFSFQMPSLDPDVIRCFIHKLKVEFDLERCAEVFVVGSRSNPRQVKRALNLFLFADYMLKSIGDSGATIKSVQLAKLIVMQQRWPELYRQCQRHPDWLKKLEEHFCLAAESKLPDHLLVLRQIFSKIDTADDYWRWFRLDFWPGDAPVPDKLNLLAAVEETVAELDATEGVEGTERKQTLHDLIELGKEHRPDIPWDQVEKDIQTARSMQRPTPLLSDDLHRFLTDDQDSLLTDSDLAGLMTLHCDQAGDCFSSLDESELKPYFFESYGVQAATLRPEEPVEIDNAKNTPDATGHGRQS